MLIAGSSDHTAIGATLTLPEGQSSEVASFNESPCGYVLEVSADLSLDDLQRSLPEGSLAREVARTNDSGVLNDNEGMLSVGVRELLESWRGTLDW